MFPSGIFRVLFWPGKASFVTSRNLNFLVELTRIALWGLYCFFLDCNYYLCNVSTLNPVARGIFLILDCQKLLTVNCLLERLCNVEYPAKITIVLYCLRQRGCVMWSRCCADPGETAKSKCVAMALCKLGHDCQVQLLVGLPGPTTNSNRRTTRSRNHNNQRPKVAETNRKKL